MSKIAESERTYEEQTRILLKERNAKKFGFCPNSGDKLRLITPFVRICDTCGIVYLYDSNGQIIKTVSEAEFFN